MTSARVVIADDHRLLRDGLRQLLHAEPGYQVVGEAGSASEAIHIVRMLAPELLLLDLVLSDGSGIEVLRGLRSSGEATRTIVLAAAAEREQVVEALRLGARGLVLKESSSTLLFRCMRAVLAGEHWVGHDRVSDVIEAYRRSGERPRPTPVESLTRRELHVVAAVVNGATNREIAEQLCLSEQTVKNHVSTIFDKVGASNRVELVLFAMHHKLLERHPPTLPLPRLAMAEAD